jgi:hypothetical protein
MKLRILSKTMSFHTLFTKERKGKKRRERTGAILTALWVFFFPWMREAGEEEDFSSSVTVISPFKKMLTPFQKDADQPHLPKRNFPRVGGVVEGRQHSGHPSHVPPLFLQQGRRRKKMRYDREGGGQREKNKEKRREEKRARVEKRGKRLKKKREEDAEKRIKNRGEWKKKEQHRQSPQTTSDAACRL